jgi:hypothetical protein
MNLLRIFVSVSFATTHWALMSVSSKTINVIVDDDQSTFVNSPAGKALAKNGIWWKQDVAKTASKGDIYDGNKFMAEEFAVAKATSGTLGTQTMESK